MNIYNGIVLWIIGLNILFSCAFPKKKRHYVLLVSLALALVCGLRQYQTLGVDLGRYYRHFVEIGSMSFLESFSYSDDSSFFYAVNWLFSMLSIDYQWFIAAMSLFCCFSFGWYVKKYSVNPMLSFFIYLGMGCYSFLFSGLRQSIAMAVVLFAIDSYHRKKFVRCGALFLTAMFFHPTAIVILPWLLVSKKPINDMVILTYGVLLVVCVLFRVQLGRLMTLIYKESYLNRYESRGEIGGTFILIVIVLALYLFINKKRIKQKGTEDARLFHSLIIMLIIQVFSSFSYAFTRINLYYMMASFSLLVPRMLDASTFSKRFIKDRGVLRYAVVLVFMLVMYRLFMGHIRGEDLLNYRFFWQSI